MKRLLRRAFLIASVLVLLPYPALAADSVDQAVAALQSSSVYVDSDAPGVTNDTASYIQQFLHTDDHVVIVLLPASSEDPSAVVQKILSSLPEKSVLGVSIGSTTKAGSNLLPTEAVNKAMSDAANISMNPQETLATFVRKIHEYQTAHPEAVPSPTHASQGRGVSWVMVTIAFVGCAALVVGGYFIWKRYRGPRSKDDLEDISKLCNFASQIEDLSTRARLQEAIKNSQRLLVDNPSRQDTANVRHAISQLVEVVEGYVAIQYDRKAYEDPDKSLKIGREAIDGANQLIATAVQQGTTEKLRSYMSKAYELGAYRDPFSNDL